MKRRLISVLLTICMLGGLVPTFISNTQVEVSALSVSSLTCSAYISNATARSYIDTMMKYYINSNSTLQSNLNAGRPVVFMFEGGSDNYWTGSDYVNDVWDVRIQAAVFVVKLDSSGNAYVAFCSENCSSIPSYAPNCTAGVGYQGSVTILDGVYRMYRWDHTGPYAAFQLDIPNSNAGGLGLYVPNSVPNGQLLGCSGINVHTRSTTSGSYWSEGCQLIGTGNDSSNEFNAFFKSVTGINASPWLSWNPKNLYTWNSLGYYYGSDYTVGYFVVDRQLGMLGMDGTKYGTGSLNNIYNTTALGKLTSYSTNAADAAGAFNQDYISANCTYYPAHCQINVTRDQAPVNSLPCSVGTTSENSTLEYAPSGSTYTATGLYKNGYGNYWYQVITTGGKTGYIYGGEAYYVKELTSDITLTGYDTPNGHVAGSVFYVNGTISSKYNQLNSAAVWIHSGFGTSGSKITGGSDTVSNNKYVLDNSNIDYNTAFNEVTTGNYTYAISVNYTNYYSEGATTLKENTKTLYLCDEYFVVIPSSVSQSSCSHTYTTTTIGSGDCTSGVTVVKSCSKCGYITETQTAGAHIYGDWTTVSATCTTDGYKVRTCSVCGNQEKETYTAVGHDYSMKVIGATCVSKVCYEYTCANCGDTYSYSGDELSNTWLEEIPEGMDPALFTTKTQYRYSDIETATSYNSTLSGYTLKSSSWEQSGTGSVQYVQNWSTGFSTSNSLYTQYNKKSSKVSAYENETTKRVINSDAITGYLYFHWCHTGSFYSYEHSNGNYTTFHAYYSTTAPWNYDCDTGDMSYNTKSSNCSNSTWYFVDEVYSQKYTDYKKLYTFERWGAYSDWSDTAVSSSSTRQVQTRTLYQLKDTGYADHSWNSGVITTNPSCTTDGVKTYTCVNCSTTKTEAVSMMGHSYNSVVTPPTCTDGGYTTHTCVNCAHSYVDSRIDAKGHSYGDWVQTVAPSCTKAGVEIRSCACGDVQSREVALISHSYNAVVTAPTCTQQGFTTHTCSVCGNSYQDSFVSPLGHSWLDATCTEAKVCTVCGERTGEAMGHQYQTVVTAPDCINGGYTTYTCSVCGNSYVDDRVPASGHSYNAVVTAPTCTTAGYTTYTCTACGSSYQDDHVSALGHSYQDAVTAPGCTTNGYTTHTCTACGNSYRDTIVPASGHTWADADCNNAKTCTVCGVTEGEPLGHTWVEADCKNAKTCSVCGATEGEALGHSYNGVVTAPSCTDPGFITYLCTVCGDTYFLENAAALGHSYDITVIAPTCTQIGYTSYVCTTCGEGYDGEYVSALGHTWVDATCTVPKTCSVCSATEGEPDGHSYNAVVTAPTCTKAGFTTYTCSVCGDSYEDDEVAALGHTWMDADCKNAKTCSVCGATEGEALGHSYETVVTPPSCGTDGYTTYTCSKCGDSYTDDKVPSDIEHSYSYAFANGKHTLTCANCGDVQAVTGTREFAIKNIGVTLGSDINVSYKNYVDDCFTDVYMFFQVTDVDGNVYESYAYDYTIDSSKRWVYLYEGVNPQLMGDNIVATLYGTLNGYQVEITKTQSVLGYCKAILGMDNMNAKTKTLVSDLLVYGEKAQLMKGYQTDNLVTTGVEGLCPSTFPGVDKLTANFAMADTELKNNVADMKSYGMELSNKVSLKFGMALDDPSLYTYQVEVSGVTELLDASALVEDTSKAGRYILYFDILATELDTPVTVRILKDGVQVSRAMTYSAADYIKLMGGADNELAALLQALYNYGKSAEVML